MNIKEHIAGLRDAVEQQYSERMAAIDSLAKSFAPEQEPQNHVNGTSSPEQQESGRQSGVSIAGCVREILDNDESPMGLTVAELLDAVTEKTGVDCISNKNNRGAVSAALSNLKKREAVVHHAATRRYRMITRTSTD